MGAKPGVPMQPGSRTGTAAATSLLLQQVTAGFCQLLVQHHPQPWKQRDMIKYSMDSNRPCDRVTLSRRLQHMMLLLWLSCP